MYGQSSPTSHSKILYLLTFSIISAIGLGSCTPSQTEPRRSTSPPNQTTSVKNAELKIVTATLPITNFTKAVAGNQAAVTYLLPTNIGSHEYQAKPEDARTLAQANVLVKNGLGIEEYLDSLIANANNPNLTVIDTSKDIEIISNQQTETHNPSEEKPAENREAHKQEGRFNPHIWLDPQRAIQQVENIRDGLIAANPQGKETYTTNAAAYINKLKALDGEIAIALRPYAGKKFVTYHDFAAYFAQRYNLKAEFLVGVPEKNPSPLDVKRVIDTTKKSDLKTLLTEPQAAGNPFEALAKDLNVQVSYFDPMETSKPQGIEPDYYFTIMRQNLKNLQTAFGTDTELHSKIVDLADGEMGRWGDGGKETVLRLTATWYESTQSNLSPWFPTTSSIFQLHTPTLSPLPTPHFQDRTH